MSATDTLEGSIDLTLNIHPRISVTPNTENHPSLPNREFIKDMVNSPYGNCFMSVFPTAIGKGFPMFYSYYTNWSVLCKIETIS